MGRKAAEASRSKSGSWPSHLGLARARLGLLTDWDAAWPAGGAGQPAGGAPRTRSSESCSFRLGSWGSFELSRLSSGSGRWAEVSRKGGKKTDVHPVGRPSLDGGRVWGGAGCPSQAGHQLRPLGLELLASEGVGQHLGQAMRVPASVVQGQRQPQTAPEPPGACPSCPISCHTAQVIPTYACL